MKRVDEKNEIKNSIDDYYDHRHDHNDYDTSESVDNDDDNGYAVKDIITINHDIMNTTTNKRRRNKGVDKNCINIDADYGDDDDDNQCIRVSHLLCIIRYEW